MDEAISNVNKCNDIIDKKTGEDQNAMLYGRYRFLKAKVLKLRNENLQALKALDEAIAKVKGNNDLRVDEHQMKEYRFSLVYSLSEEEMKQSGIELDKEQAEEKKYKEGV